jgi:hypothetical protein
MLIFDRFITASKLHNVYKCISMLVPMAVGETLEQRLKVISYRLSTEQGSCLHDDT